MPKLVAKAYWTLLFFHLYLARQNFQALYEGVRRVPVRVSPTHRESIEQICRAVDLASIWYWRRVLCLQRSAVTTSLLREYGIAAELVIGAKQHPFRAHAWVEVAGRVVNDKSYVRDIYGVLTRC